MLSLFALDTARMLKILEKKIEEMFEAFQYSKKSSWEYLPRKGHLPTCLQCVGERVDKNAEFREMFFLEKWCNSCGLFDFVLGLVLLVWFVVNLKKAFSI